ncbi:Low conductance mechanosensitive channel YnaI [Thalassocella blandensis]|nr:Low conductance mechanosensitive channel YnaI [Thalassocella blandensis]
MNISAITSLGIPPLLIIGFVILVSTFVMLIVKRIALKRLRKMIDKTSYQMDSLLVSAVKLPLTIVILVANLVLFEHLLDLFAISDDRLGKLVTRSSQLLIVVAVVVFVDRFLYGFIGGYTEKSESLRSSRSILLGITRGFILALGLLILLGTLGISITPIIASLGITSLAVALALQPTLENFFSGVQLVIDKPVRVGDFIELDSGEQGFVEKIGWRSTWIKMLPNNTVIVPNSVLSNSKIINYFYPQRELSVPVEVGVHYSSDLEFVEQVTLEVARETLKSHKWGVEEYDTFLVFHTFSDSSINFTVMLRAQEYFNRFFIKSAFIKALHKRYAEEGIVIPYPIRAINTEQEKVTLVTEAKPVSP